ncbi:MAG: methyltransferase domain-containing protein [Bacteroidota bacterium]|nr:methyltransferase domain-containing protein [Bacteroidota bacterium]
MFSITNRNYSKELLDADDIPKEDLFQNLKELNFINTWLGGHSITLTGIKQFNFIKNQTFRIADIGCGGGDNLIQIAKWARKTNIKVELIGIDLKQDCINYAFENCKNHPEIKFICSDYSLVKETFDITFSSLFCHHLNEMQLKEYISWSNEHSKIGFFINDLERNWLAYYSIKLLTHLFSKSYLVKNDAPLSVSRGFVRKDWEKFTSAFDKIKAQIRWKWAFRHLVIVNTN